MTKKPGLPLPHTVSALHALAAEGRTSAIVGLLGGEKRAARLVQRHARRMGTAFNSLAAPGGIKALCENSPVDATLLVAAVGGFTTAAEDLRDRGRDRKARRAARIPGNNQ